ncbi:MAG TPA: L-rhamnose mutarotase, partial [Chloroflexota bacterium]|nr:L-rhamnose mutarotase [Chloroflexota bacterium]
MKSYGLTICLRNDPEKIKQYVEYHAAVWPEVLKGIQAVGIEQMQIFLRGTRMFMYIQTSDDFDPERDWPRAGNASEESREWNRIMGDLQERAPEANEDEWWAFMDE